MNKVFWLQICRTESSWFTMADSKPVKAGSRVEVIGKGIVGTVAFVGGTKFSTGKFTDLFFFERGGMEFHLSC